MFLQPFVGDWPLFQFLNLIHIQFYSFDGGSARRKAATYAQNKRTQTSHALSGIRAHDPSVGASEDGSCLKGPIHVRVWFANPTRLGFQ